MNLRKSIAKIERKIGIGNDWEQLWSRYRDLYRYDGMPLNDRAIRPLPPCTIQDDLFEQRDWILDIQSGGKEMQLAKKRFAYPEKFQEKFEGVTLKRANLNRELSETFTPYYARALQNISEASNQGYRSPEIDPVNQANFRRFFGQVSYKKLERVVARYEKNKPSLFENHGYGPPEFRIFREAGKQGDQSFRQDFDRLEAVLVDEVA